jgi:Flp pilus assembly protein TadG
MSMKAPFRRDERGASLLVVAFSLLVLLGFAATAVDLAGAWALRRQDQAAADTAAIAGALVAVAKPTATAISDATDEVIRISYETIDPNMTPAQWIAEWTSCVDTDKPAQFTETGISDCISFTSDLNSIRVMTPNIPWQTTFARVLGFDEIDTDAFAEVVTEPANNGGVMPFAMPSGAAASGEVCLKTGSNPNGIPPCDGPVTGNFGFLDYTKFGNPGPTQCVGGNDRLEDNIAVGIDHILGETKVLVPPASPNLDRDACDNADFRAWPYQVTTATGNVLSALDEGLVDGTSNGNPGRLTQSGNVVNVRGHFLDNTPLWDHLNGSGQAMCGLGPTPTHDDLIACILNPANYSGGAWVGGEIFDEDLVDNNRFGWVPLTHEAVIGPGSIDVTIKDYRPVYIQTTLWGCNAMTCDLFFDPGEPFGSGPSNLKVEAVTAIAIPYDSLPESIKLAAPGTLGQIRHLLSR